MDRDGATEQDLHFSTAGEVALNTEDMAAAAGGGVPNPTGFDPMEEHQVAVMSEKDMWVDRDEDSLLDMNEASIFYDDFPPLPDFPCMSSSSSSSSTQPPSLKPMAGTSSSSSATSSSPVASWAMLRSDAEEDTARVKMEVAAAALTSTASMEIQPPSSEHDGGGGGLGDVDCVDVMENFRYMDLIDCNELWDPSSVFLEDQQAAEQAVAPPPVEGNEINYEEDNDGFSFLQGNSELAMIFFEWLKQNKDYISAEDMRSIKLKRSTIESASKRLGSSEEGKKQLLKLILEWVEQYQLQKKARLREDGAAAAAAQSPFSFEETVQIPDPNANPNFMYNPPVPPDPNTTFPTTTQWMQPPPSPEMVEAPLAFAPPMPGYSSDPYSMNHGVVNGIPYQQHSAEYPVMEHAPPWAFLVPPPPPQFSPFPDNGGGIINRQQNVYGNPCQMYDPNGERMRRLGSSATKEARKKRMARQRKLYPHHHRHSSNSNPLQNQLSDPHLVGDGVVDDGDQGSSLGDWLYWSQGGAASSSPTAMNVPPADAPPPNSGDGGIMQPQTSQLQASSDRRQQQGLKTEKNLKFLLQKVLKQSDVGNLGRIVLPKKEAESHLPELETRDGISIAMEDIGTSRIWNMRYRFWPNNKSRMYLLENTGDFVRVNGLQEGDFIVIYSDTKCGKYMIRGVKVRQPGGKLKGKKPVRRNIRNLSSLAGNSSSLAPLRQAVR